MYRRAVGLLLFLLLLQLSSAGLIVAARAESDTASPWEMDWTVDYGGGRYTPPENDQLGQFLGFERGLLADGGQLHLRITQVITAEQDNRYRLEATITAGEQQLTLEGEGEYDLYQATPLLSGQFAAESSRDDECQIYLSYYPTDGQIKVTLQFGAGTPAESLLVFGEDYGNIQAIYTQLNERAKQAVKLPSAFWLDGVKLIFQPDALLQDDQVLVPARQLLQALGASVGWDSASQSVVAGKGDLKLRLAVGSDHLLVGQSPVQLETAVTQQSGVIYAPYAPLAEALGATAIARSNGDVSLISAERQLQEQQGRLQIILLGSEQLIIQNDTDRSLPLGAWSLLSLGAAVPQEFRFPADFVLRPGEQAQLLDDAGAAADQQSVWQWSDTAADAAPAEFQLMIAGTLPGDERLILNNRGQADIYLGNWRLVSTLGKPALQLPSRYLAAGDSLSIVGTPGQAANSQEVRWPNLSSVEQAYLEEQERLAAMHAEIVEQIKADYAPLTEALGIDQLGYYFYTATDGEMGLSRGELPPFQDNPAAGVALVFAKIRFLEPQLATGDRMPVYFVDPNGQEAYLALRKADGSLVAYRLQYAQDMGFSTWLAEQVLPQADSPDIVE